MPGSEEKLANTVRNSVLGWLYLARTQEEVNALERLTNDGDALMAWSELSKKKTKTGDSFEIVASFIGKDAIGSHLSSAHKKTRQEIRDAGFEAVTLGKRLISLIDGNATLRFHGDDLMPQLEQAALERLLGGLIIQAVNISKQNRGSGNFFSAEIEAELDSSLANNHPEFKTMTSSEAYRVIRLTQTFDDGFIERLKLFVQLAEQSANKTPVVARPNKLTANQHVFSRSVCGILEYFYGSPHCEIVARFASAVFDTSVSYESVQKWWQRRAETIEEDTSQEE